MLDSPSDQVTDPIRIIHEAGTHLNETVSLMLSFLEIRGQGERKDSFQAIHFKTYISELIAGRAGGVLPSSVTLDLEDIQYLGADLDALTQILHPIIDNAFKFDSAHNLRVMVRWIDFKGEPGLRIRISDQGPGIATEIHHSLFEPFIHARPPSDHLPTGRGLGLALAKAIADSLGWHLALDRDAKPGATFVLELRARPPQ